MTNRRTLFVIACLGLVTFGIVLTLLGTVLPSVIERFGIGKAAAGSLFLLNTFGILVGSLVFGPVVDRWGYKEMLLVALGIVVVGIEGIAFASSMIWLRASLLLTGFGGGMINGGTNALVADISTEGRTAGLSRLAIFFGVGAVGVPFALGSLLGAFSYAGILATVGALIAIPLAATAITPFPAPKQARGFPVDETRRLLRDPVLLTFGLMLFLESGMEITVGGWTTTFFKEELSVPDRDALVYLSLFWLGMMVGRTAMGVLLRLMTPPRLLFGCLTIGLAGSLLLITTRNVSLATIGVFLIGLGFAATYPVVLGFVGDRYAELSGTAFSVVMAMALTGGMIVPYLTGILGGAFGLRASLLVVPTALVLLVALLVIASSRLTPARASDVA